MSRWESLCYHWSQNNTQMNRLLVLKPTVWRVKGKVHAMELEMRECHIADLCSLLFRHPLPRHLSRGWKTLTRLPGSRVGFWGMRSLERCRRTILRTAQFLRMVQNRLLGVCRWCDPKSGYDSSRFVRNCCLENLSTRQI